MIKIDGSFGEGGGQILRYSAALAAATGQNVEVFNIRANRPNPGLRPQHYSSLKIMKKIFGGEIEGLKIGSKRVVIKFKGPRAGNLKYDIGTAGSISLVIQSIVPALILADDISSIELIGGTDVKWSPTIDYMKYIYTSIVSFFGGFLDINVIKRGYYPRGGGIVSMKLIPSRKINPINSVNREIRSVLKFFDEAGLSTLKNMIRIERLLLGMKEAAGPGTSILIAARHSDMVYSGGDSIGEKGKPAENVAHEAFQSFFEWYSSESFFDIHSGDMIIPFLALAEGNSVFSVPRFTKHMESALYVAKELLGTKYKIKRSGRFHKIYIWK